LYRRHSVPGIGTLLRVGLLDELHDLTRFPRVQDGGSYCRLVTGAQASAGKRSGTSGTKSGNASLKGAFSEAAVLLLRHKPAGQKSLARFEPKPGTGKASTIFAHP
jgi:transposase